MMAADKRGVAGEDRLKKSVGYALVISVWRGCEKPGRVEFHM